jgi:perosamine synthetase
MKIYPTSKPYITHEDRKSVLEVLNSDYLSLGPKIVEFEKKFAKKIGVKYACAVSSGTAGLHLAMLACGIGAGDEVITSPFSFVASANSVLYVGAKPVFVDIDPITYNMDPAKIEAMITRKTKAILVVHIFGQPCDMDQIIGLAKKYNLQIVEDACESICATYKGKQVGTFGKVGVFAFYPNKQMTTGEGGMVVTDDYKIYKICESLKNQGRSENDQWLDHKYLGYNYRLDELSSALGIAQLKKLNFMIRERKKIANWYNKALKPYESTIQTPLLAVENTHTWFVYVIKIKDNKINRNRLIKNLKEVGVSTKPYLPSIHLFDYYEKMFKYKEGDFPTSEDVSTHSLALPIYLGLKEVDCKLIVRKLIGEMNSLTNRQKEYHA